MSLEGLRPFLKNEGRKKCFRTFSNFMTIVVLTLREYLDLIAFLEEGFEKVGFMKVVANSINKPGI